MLLNPLTQFRQMRTLSTTSQRQSQPDEIIWNPNANAQAHKNSSHKVDLTQVFNAQQLFSKTDVVQQTELTFAAELSQQYGAQIYLKRQDTQRGRTFKIRGSYYQYLQADKGRREQGFIIVSDGNLACSFAIISGMFKTKSIIFVPINCHEHKLESMKKDGGEYIEIKQVGNDFEQCVQIANQYAEENKIPIIKSFESLNLLQGFGTIAKQIIDMRLKKGGVDYILVPTGGGGLVSTLASVFKQLAPHTKIIGVQPENCKPYSTSILKGSLVAAEKASRFLSGSSVKQTSKTSFDMGRTSVDGFVEVNERKVAEKVIRLYSQGFICEPSGALAVTGLQKIKQMIKGKTVVCVLTGANIDLIKLDQARQMAMVSKGVKNHFQFRLPNKKGIIYELITECFKETDVVSIHYSKKLGKHESQAVLSVESRNQGDVEEYLEKLVQNKYQFENINDKEDMLDMFF